MTIHQIFYGKKHSEILHTVKEIREQEPKKLTNYMKACRLFHLHK